MRIESRGVKTRKVDLESQGFFGYDVPMKMILFRHAEKTSDGTSNPKLSPRGREQAEKLSEEVSAKKLPKPQVLLVSPRSRAQETFAVLSQKSGVALKVTDLLDERKPEESSADFRRRVQELLVLIQMDYQDNDCVYLCTHFDWIEEFLTVVESSTDLLQNKYHHWGSGQWMWFEKDDLWNLMKFDQIKL